MTEKITPIPTCTPSVSLDEFRRIHGARHDYDCTTLYREYIAYRTTMKLEHDRSFRAGKLFTKLNKGDDMSYINRAPSIAQLQIRYPGLSTPELRQTQADMISEQVGKTALALGVDAETIHDMGPNRVAQRLDQEGIELVDFPS